MIHMEWWRLLGWVVIGGMFGYAIGRMVGYFRREQDAEAALNEAIAKLPKGATVLVSVVERDDEEGTGDESESEAGIVDDAEDTEADEWEE